MDSTSHFNSISTDSTLFLSWLDGLASLEDAIYDTHHTPRSFVPLAEIPQDVFSTPETRGSHTEVELFSLQAERSPSGTAAGPAAVLNQRTLTYDWNPEDGLLLVEQTDSFPVAFRDEHHSYRSHASVPLDHLELYTTPTGAAQVWTNVISAEIPSSSLAWALGHGPTIPDSTSTSSFTLIPSSEPIPPPANPDMDVLQCTHCHTRKSSPTSPWRRDSSGNRVCNACGLYERRCGKRRPLRLVGRGVRKSAAKRIPNLLV
ncbi:hypothetical protein FB45DRAFT_1060595 [Roridomyces roridus]|uniref:GATA-type domain-containing protein n=1 Tax=Roridomyces roridus TaxID=1738132 RepID=A0AAD7BP35_9AGAR|nr:hypothetical protein FB45DRAFT_1060595 [Roridomyces roridus]